VRNGALSALSALPGVRYRLALQLSGLGQNVA
jgi:hypothetical protein